MSLPTNSVGYKGVRARRPPETNPNFGRDPTPEDYRNYVFGDEVRNQNTDTWWKYCGFSATSLADWQKMSGPGSGIEKVTSDSGFAIADSNNNVNVFGDPATGTSTSASTSTLTVHNILASDSETITGSITNKPTVPHGINAKLGAQTSHGGAYGSGASSALGWTSGLNDGQLMIGSSIGIPASGNLTSVDGSVIITNGNNTIDLSTTGHGQELDQITTDDGAQVLPAITGNINWSGNSAEGVHTTGNVGTFTATVNVDHASGPQTIAGSATNLVVDPSGLTAKLGVQTSHGGAYGAGTSSALGWTSGLNDGQLMIGSSIGIPASGNLTSLDGSVVIVNGHNTIDLSTTGHGQEVDQVTTDDGAHVVPDSDGNLNWAGNSAEGVHTTGNVGTFTATVNVDHASGPQTIAGSATNLLVDPSGLTAKLGVQTATGVPYGTGTAAAIGWTAAMTDGQIPIGSSIGNPVSANITSTDGSVVITNGHNTIDLSTTGHGQEVDQITTDDGAHVVPDTDGNINWLGNSAEGVHTTGNVGAFTATVNVDHASGAQTIAGSATNLVVDPSGLTAKLGVQTSHGAAYGSGTSSALGWTAALTDGQLMVGSSLGIPASANLTSVDGSVIITNGHNTIDLSTTGHGQELDQVTTDDGVQVLPAITGNINWAGNASEGVHTTGNAGTFTATVNVDHASGAQTIAGSATNLVVDPLGLTAKLGTQTSTGVPFGAGTSSAIGWTAGMTDGQIPIGSSAGNPAAANITSADGTVVITNGHNTIDLSANGGVVTTFYSIDNTLPSTALNVATYALNDKDILDLSIVVVGTTIGGAVDFTLVYGGPISATYMRQDAATPSGIRPIALVNSTATNLPNPPNPPSQLQLAVSGNNVLLNAYAARDYGMRFKIWVTKYYTNAST